MAVLKLEPQTEKLMREVLAALKPPPSLTLSLWAETYRTLAAEYGPARAPGPGPGGGGPPPPFRSLCPGCVFAWPVLHWDT